MFSNFVIDVHQCSQYLEKDLVERVYKFPIIIGTTGQLWELHKRLDRSGKIHGCVQWKAQRNSASIRDHQQEDIAHIVNIDVKFGEPSRAQAVAGSVMWGKVLASELVTGWSFGNINQHSTYTQTLLPVSHKHKITNAVNAARSFISWKWSRYCTFSSYQLEVGLL